MTRRPIAVLGATGYTGRLVVEELRRLGVPALLAARDPGRLSPLAATGDFETLQVDVRDPDALARLAGACRVLINTAGPFVDLGDPVVRAAIAGGCHYADTTGEQPFLLAVRAHDAAARERGVAVVPSLAFEIAVGDCAAAVAAAGFREVHSVHLTYATRFHASQGTRRTVVRALQAGGYAYVHGEWVDDTPASEVRTADFPPPVGRVTAVSAPLGEVVTVPQHLRVREVRTFLAVPRAAAVTLHWLGRPLVAALRGPLGRLAARAIGSGTGGPPPHTRASDTFAILVEVRGIRAGIAGVERLLVRGRDPYGLTATIAVAGAVRMAEPGFARRGVLPPAAAFDPRALLAELAAAGVSVDHLGPASGAPH